MANGLWVGSVNESVSRRGAQNVQVSVTDPVTGNLLGLYRDRDGLLPLGNPFLTREDGLIKFYVRAGRINIEAYKAGSSEVFENEVVLDDWNAHDCSCGNVFGEYVAAWSGEEATQVPAPEDSAVIMFYFTLPEHPTTEVWVESALGVRWPGTYSYVPLEESPESGGRVFGVAGFPAGGDGSPGLFMDAFGPVSLEYQSIRISNLSLSLECLIQAASLTYGSSELSVEAPSNCERGYGAVIVVSPDDFGYGTPGMSGYETQSETDWKVSDDYADSSQGVTVGVASGTILMAAIALRTLLVPPPPAAEIAVTLVEGVEITISVSMSEEDRELVTSGFLAQYREEGGLDWLNASSLSSSDTEFVYSLDPAIDYEIRVVSVGPAGETPSNLVEATTEADGGGDVVTEEKAMIVGDNGAGNLGYVAGFIGSMSPDNTLFPGIGSFSVGISHIYADDAGGYVEFGVTEDINNYGLPWEAGDLVSFAIYNGEASYFYDTASLTYLGGGAWESSLYGGSFLPDASEWSIEINMIIRSE